jgi:hypothetical protein
VWLDNVQVIDVGATAGVDRVVTGSLADADGRWDILDRKAFLEESEDVGSTWDVLCAGYVTDVKLDNALVAGITVSETRRADSTLRVFDTYDGSLGQPTCLIGGPVEGGFAGVRDFGPAVFKVTATDSLKVMLQYDSGPLPPTYFSFAATHLTAAHCAEVNRRAGGYFTGSSAWSAANGPMGYFPGLVARLYAITSGSLTGEFTPIAQPPAPTLGGPGGYTLHEDRLLANDGTLFLDWPASGAPVAQPSVGTRFNLYCFPTKISEENPLHLSGHPIDIDTTILTAKGIAYDAASAASVKAALGPVTAVMYRLTSGDTVSGWTQKCLRGPFGYTVRQNDAGEREYILVRPRETATPTATITLDDLRGGDDGPEGVVFDLDASSKRNVVVVNALNFRRWTDADGDAGVEQPRDFILTTSQNITEELDSDGDGTPDWETVGRKEVTYELPGTIAFNAAQVGSSTTSLSQLVTSIASEVFAIRGRGAPVGDAPILRGCDADAARVGDFVLVNCDHIPSTDTTQSPTGVRGGTVVAQVLRRTRVAGGADLHLEYRGTATQTALVPTFTVTKNADDPRHTATFTLTNGPALAAAGAVVRVQMATGTSTPTAGAPLRVIDPTVTTAFDLPGQDAGTKVWASARAEVGVEAPGAYTAFAGVTLDSLTAPSSLSASASSNVVTMSWTVGDSDVPEEIIFKLSGEADYRAPIPVAAGTDHYTLILPTAGTWTVGVRERESPPYNGVSAAATASVTTSTASALAAPLNPSVYADGNGAWFIACDMTAFPSQMEVYVAVETAVGSGTFGTYASAGTPVPSVQNGRTIFSAFAPNDGKLRSVEARTIQDGATASAFTTPQSVNPWTQTSAAPAPPALTATVDASGNVTVAYVNPPEARSLRIAIASGSAPSDATTRAATAIDGTTGTTTGTVTAGTTAYAKAFSYSGLAGAGAESLHATVVIATPPGGVTDADFLVKTAHAGLSAERVVTDTAEIAVDWATAGQAKFGLVLAGPTKGGTGLSSYSLGDLLYASATNTLAKLVGNTTTTKKFLTQTGTGSVSAAPAWAALAGTDLPASGVTANTYGDATHVPVITVDATGRITAASLATISGGGGSGGAYLTDSPDAPPTSPSTYDDEFSSGTSLDAKWTQTLTGTSPTIAVNTTQKSHYWATFGNADGSSLLSQSAFAPAGDFSITAKVRAGLYSTTQRVMIWSRNTASTEAIITAVECRVATSQTFVAYNETASSFAVEATVNLPLSSTFYIHQQRVGTTWTHWYSTDGYAWILMRTSTKTLTVNRVDFYLQQNGAVVRTLMGWDWIRFNWLTL